MSSVLFGQSYYLRFDPKLWDAMKPYPPLGTLYAAAHLRALGHEVDLFDAMLAESEAGWAEALEHHRPDHAVIFDDNFNYLSKMCLLRMREAAQVMLGSAETAGANAVICSSDATDHPTEYLDHGADFVLAGEGEIALGTLLDTVDREGAARDVVGITYRETDGSLRSTGRQANVRDLDSLPYPARDLVDVDRYRAAWSRHGRFSTNLVTTRGCPFACNWCAKPIWGRAYNSRSPENVVGEIEQLRGTWQPDHLSIVDDIFGLTPGWIAEFAELINERDLVTPFGCLSRADLLLRAGEVEALAQAGCETVWIGAESGSQKILDAMDKGTTVEQIIEAARLLESAGIEVGFFLQFGYPGEGWHEIEQTFDLIATCRPDDIGVSVSYPLPGTPFHERVASELSIRQNWQDSADLAMLYEGPFTTDFYRRLHGTVHRHFRLHREAGTTSPVSHLTHALRHPFDRRSARRVIDAAALPIELRRLGRIAASHERNPSGRADV